MPSTAQVAAALGVAGVLLCLACLHRSGIAVSQVEQRIRRSISSEENRQGVGVVTAVTNASSLSSFTTQIQQQQQEVVVRKQDDSYEVTLRSQSVRRTSDLDGHGSGIELLDLFDWELDSLNGIVVSNTVEANKSCNPPNGTNIACCVGAIAGKKNGRSVCAGKTLQDYQMLRDVILPKHLLPIRATTAKCDLCRILDLCYLHNITFGVYGDSVTRQAMESFECALLRRNYQIQKTVIDPRSYWILTISSPDWDRPVVFHHYTRFFVPESLEAVVLSKNHSAVNAILFNFGLHYSFAARRGFAKATKYEDLLDSLFQDIGNKADKFQLLLYRETSAQHFDADAGDYHLAKNQSSVTFCTPMRANSTMAGWREPYVHRAAIKGGLEVVHAQQFHKKINAKEEVSNNEQKRKQLIILPFFNYTRDLNHLHPKHADCTHFCQIPYLFLPLWRSMRIVMEEAF